MYFLEGRKPGLRLYAFSRRVNDNVRVPLLSWFPSVLTELSRRVKDKVKPPLLSWCPKVLAELEATHFHFRVHLFHRRMVAYVAAHTPPLHAHRKASWRFAGRLLVIINCNVLGYDRLQVSQKRILLIVRNHEVVIGDWRWYQVVIGDWRWYQKRILFIIRNHKVLVIGDWRLLAICILSNMNISWSFA